MIGITSEKVIRAGDSKMQSLAFLLWISVFAHGAFFPQEWSLLGAGTAFLQAWGNWELLPGVRPRLKIRRSEIAEFRRLLSWTDGMFLTLTGLSLLGILHPVKVSEGWLDAIRWATLWLVYRHAREIREKWAQEKMLRSMEKVGVFLAFVAWLPRVSGWVTGSGILPMAQGGPERLASLLGYPNALAAYLAAILLLHPQSMVISAVLLISLLNTGSRAAISLFFVIEVIHRIPKLRKRLQSFVCYKRGLRWGSDKSRKKGWGLSIMTRLNRKRIREQILVIIILTAGLIMTVVFNRQALQHLLDWGLRNSLGERLLYFRDGITLARRQQGLPQAGGWLAFPLVQEIPYWTTDPHSILIRVLLNQGVLGLFVLFIWSIRVLKRIEVRRFLFAYNPQDRNGYTNKEREDAGTTRRVGMINALIFLALHAMVDTDFLFGTLGILFWTLFGLLAANYEVWNGKRSHPVFGRFSPSRLRSRVRDRGFRYLQGWQGTVFFLFLGLLLVGVSVKPQWIEPQRTWIAEWAKAKENPQESLNILQRASAVDQTDPIVRRERAKLEISLHGVAGLEAVEDVIAWERFNLRAYEWTQGIVLEEAEKRRKTDPDAARTLYRWCERIPSRIPKTSSLGSFEQSLWSGAKDFHPSELMILLANTAKERQLTLR